MKIYIILFVFIFCVLPVLSDTVKTNTCLNNLYETKSEVVSTPTNAIVTKPKRKLFGKKKEKNSQYMPDVIVPVDNNGFIVFPLNTK